MARINNGITDIKSGPVGALLFRKKKNGQTIVVPRYRHDKKSPEQLAERAVFRFIMKLGSKAYLSVLNPYYNVKKMRVPPLALMVRYTVASWDIQAQYFHVYLTQGILPAYQSWALTLPSYYGPFFINPNYYPGEFHLPHDYCSFLVYNFDQSICLGSQPFRKFSDGPLQLPFDERLRHGMFNVVGFCARRRASGDFDLSYSVCRTHRLN